MSYYMPGFLGVVMLNTFSSDLGLVYNSCASQCTKYAKHLDAQLNTVQLRRLRALFLSLQACPWRCLLHVR